MKLMGLQRSATSDQRQPETQRLTELVRNRSRRSQNPVTLLPRLTLDQRRDVLALSHELALNRIEQGGFVRGVLLLAPPDSTACIFPYYEPNGFMEKLADFCESIAHSYRWSNEDALAFLLLGTKPRIQGNFSFKMKWYPSRVAPALDRIVMEIDPAASPKDVRDAFARERAKRTPHHRRLSPKHQALALFVGSEDFNSADLWLDRMAIWNARESTEPGWSYSNVSVFQRDALVARRRILGTQSKSEDRDE